MSKSYGKTIPLFAPTAELKKTVRRITTDSTPVEAPKDPDTSSVFHLLAHFADPVTTAEVQASWRPAGSAGAT